MEDSENTCGNRGMHYESFAILLDVISRCNRVGVCPSLSQKFNYLNLTFCDKKSVSRSPQYLLQLRIYLYKKFTLILKIKFALYFYTFVTS